ncbi:hypothetical protein ACFLYD_01340 [Chloroflexota bacterium]
MFVRLSWPVASDFPLNDGGFFSVMVRDLQANHFALPWYTSFNSAHIPFAYPPLAFYLAAVVEYVTPWSLGDIFRLMPAIITCLTLPAFYALAREIHDSRQTAGFALWAFALLPQAYRWFIMGGGVTRSLGFLFALLALRQAYLLYTRGEGQRVVVGCVFAALTLLSHPPAFWFLAYSIGGMILFFGRSRQGIVHSLLLAGGTLLVASPWLITVIVRHGDVLLRTLVDSGTRWYGGLAHLVLLEISDEPLAPLLAVIGLLGLLLCLVERRFFLPVWLLLAYLFDSRVPNWYATIPLALLAGMGATGVLIPLLTRQQKTLGRDLLVAAVVGFLLLYTIFAALVLPAPMLSLPSEEREAMHWVADNTPEASTVLVVSYVRWPWDRSCEWLPVLGQRPCVNLVQGYEWLPGFSDRVDQHDALLECSGSAEDCLGQWSSEYGVSFSHVFVPKWPLDRTAAIPPPIQSPAAMIRSLDADPGYRLVYDGPGAVVYSTLDE